MSTSSNSASNPGSPGRPVKIWAYRLNRWTWIGSRYWLRILLVVIGIYVLLPFVAPTLMHFGLTGPANLLYIVYSPMCHQLPFRSWFLFGEQGAYPLEAARVPNLKSYEQVGANTGAPPIQWTLESQLEAKQFNGNPQMGYKVAICERDIGIFGALFLGGLIYAIPVVRRYLRPVPLWLYLLLGIVPIGIDGFSQLLGYPPFNLWPVRETSPFLRSLTGILFGLMNAWLAFPHLEASARDVVIELEHKFARHKQRQQQTAEA